MSFFTEELMKCTEYFENRKCIGNVVYIPLGDNNRLKLEFVTLGHKDHYTALQMTTLDKTSGTIDCTALKLADVWGKKQVTNPNFRDGIYPYIWKDGMKADWYVYRPTPRDMEQLSEQIYDYAELFMEQKMELTESEQPTMTMSM